MIEPTFNFEIFDKSSKILLVDDHETTRLLAEKMLEKAGYRKIHQAMSAQGAWDKLTTAAEDIDPYDFLILDWHMPEMNGFELFKKMRKEEHFRKLPVMFLTGENGREAVQEAVREGVDAYVLKPFSYKQLMLGIHNLYRKATAP